MIGSLDLTQKKVTVVGAGIAGLLAADALDAGGYEVTVFEASSRAGGLIQTFQTPLGMAEAAAHSLLATPETYDLCNRLGVELIGVKKDSRARYIWRAGRMRKMPIGFKGILSAVTRAYFALPQSKISDSQVTLEEWARKHLGQEALDYLLNPFLRGIYAARPDQICVEAAFPSLLVPAGHSLLSAQLAKKRRQKTSHKKIKSVMVTPAGGMGALAGALEGDLRLRLGSRFRVGESIDQIADFTGNVMLCVPAYEAARLLLRIDPTTSQALKQVAYAPLVSVTAFIAKKDLSVPISGVGVLVPEKETLRQCLGILFNSSSFEGRVNDSSKIVSVTLMFGGTSAPHWIHSSDEQLIRACNDELAEMLKVTGKATELKIHRWERAVPVYGHPLMEAWGHAKRGWCSHPGHLLFGNYTGQVSVRGMIQTAAKFTALSG